MFKFQQNRNNERVSRSDEGRGLVGNGQTPRSGSTRAQDTSTLAYLINLVGFICLI